MKAILTLIGMGLLIGTAAGLLLFDGTPKPDGQANTDVTPLSGEALWAALENDDVICRNVTDSYPGTIAFFREGDVRFRTELGGRTTHAIYADDTRRIWRDGARQGERVTLVRDEEVAPRVPSPTQIEKVRQISKKEVTALVLRGPFECVAAAVDASLFTPPAPITFSGVDRTRSATTSAL
jgi:hypothetical protein